MYASRGLSDADSQYVIDLEQRVSELESENQQLRAVRQSATATTVGLFDLARKLRQQAADTTPMCQSRVLSAIAADIVELTTPLNDAVTAYLESPRR